MSQNSKPPEEITHNKVMQSSPIAAKNLSPGGTIHEIQIRQIPEQPNMKKNYQKLGKTKSPNIEDNKQWKYLILDEQKPTQRNPHPKKSNNTCMRIRCKTSKPIKGRGGQIKRRESDVMTTQRGLHASKRRNEEQ